MYAIELIDNVHVVRIDRIRRPLRGRRSSGIAEQRVEAPGNGVGLHAVKLVIDDGH